MRTITLPWQFYVTYTRTNDTLKRFDVDWFDLEFPTWKTKKKNQEVIIAIYIKLSIYDKYIKIPTNLVC